jgi:hypothetical protein
MTNFEQNSPHPNQGTLGHGKLCNDSLPLNGDQVEIDY